MKKAGFTLIELTVSLGLVGVILLGVNHLMSNSGAISARSKADLAIEEMLFRVKKLSRNKEKCIQIVSGATTSSNFSFSLDGKTFGAGEKIDTHASIKSLASSLNLTDDKGHLKLSFTFEKSINKNISIVERSLLIGVITDQASGDLVCEGANDVAIETHSTEDFCESLGGDYSTGSCVFGANLNPALEKRISEFYCKSIGGVFDGDKCNQISLPQQIESENISDQKICLSGDCRMKFDNTSCASGYLAGLSVDGLSKECKDLTFTTSIACVPSCTCAKTTKSTATCDDGCGGTCQGLDCDYLDRYESAQSFPTSEAVWAQNTQTCDYVNYNDLSSPGTCKEDGRISMNAGICKKFQAGSCTGTEAPIIVNVVEDTTCGIDKVCKSGVCTPVVATDPCEVSGTCSWEKQFAGDSEVGNRGCSWEGSPCLKLDDQRKCQPQVCPTCVSDPIWYTCKRK